MERARRGATVERRAKGRDAPATAARSKDIVASVLIKEEEDRRVEKRECV